MTGLPLLDWRPRSVRRAPLEDRFLAKTRNDGDCIAWTSSKNPDGYGNFSVRGRQLLAHRWAYERWVGPIPSGMHIDHLCKNPSCVNVRHMEVVTPYENNRRGVGITANNLRKTACVRGHPFDAANTRIHYGHRYCRACQRDRARERRARR